MPMTQPLLPEQETRTVPGTIEARTAPDGPPQLVGYAAVFNSPTRVGSFEERIAEGAFSDAIAQDDVRALFNHDPNYILGRTTAGTLRLAQDARGLRYEVDLPDTAWARDLWASVQRGDITQSSFAFAVAPDGEQWDGTQKPPVRTLTRIHLFDVSPVTYPAYTQTTVAVRAEARAAELAATHPPPPSTDVEGLAACRSRYVARRLAARAGV